MMAAIDTPAAGAVPVVHLDAIAANIRSEHTQFQSHAKASLEHALAAGKLLIDAKERIGHGKWAAWIETNCGFSERLAQKYMQVARQVPKLDPANTPRVADLSFRAALELIASSAKAASKIDGPDQGHVLEAQAEAKIPNMTQAAQPYVSSRKQKRRALQAEARKATVRAQIEEEHGPLPAGEPMRLCGFDRAQVDVILEELTRSAGWYHDLAAKMSTVYEPTLPRLAQQVVTAIHDLRQRLSHDAQALAHAVYSLRELLKDGPLLGSEIAAWKQSADISLGLLLLAAKLAGTVRQKSDAEPPGRWQRRKAAKKTGRHAAPSCGNAYLSERYVWRLLDDDEAGTVNI